MPSLIPAASRVMSVFEVFARQKRALSNSEMTRLLSIADSSCSDLMYTLHSMGYLTRTSKTRCFYPTHRLFEVAHEISKNDPLVTVGREAVELLTEKTNESAFFGVLDGAAARIAAVQPARLSLRYVLDVGARVALHASAVGKALLATMSPEDAKAALHKHALAQVTASTITDPEKLLAQIAEGRERGWHEVHGEGTEGIIALAVSSRIGEEPIALSVAGPTERVNRHRDAYVQALQEVLRTLHADT